MNMEIEQSTAKDDRQNDTTESIWNIINRHPELDADTDDNLLSHRSELSAYAPEHIERYLTQYASSPKNADVVKREGLPALELSDMWSEANHARSPENERISQVWNQAMSKVPSGPLHDLLAEVGKTVETGKADAARLTRLLNYTSIDFTLGNDAHLKNAVEQSMKEVNGILRDKLGISVDLRVTSGALTPGSNSSREHVYSLGVYTSGSHDVAPGEVVQSHLFIPLKGALSCDQAIKVANSGGGADSDIRVRSAATSSVLEQLHHQAATGPVQPMDSGRFVRSGAR